MTPEQQIRAWANDMASRLMSQAKVTHYGDLRARALKDMLESIQPGFSNRVTAAAVALQRQGVQPLNNALRQALSRRLEIYLRSLLKQGGAFDTEADLGDCAGSSLGTFNAQRFGSIMNAVNQSLAAIGEATTSIYSAATESRDRREERRAQERAAQREQELARLEAEARVRGEERSHELERARAEHEQRLAEMRMQAEERRARLEAARERREERERRIEEERAAEEALLDRGLEPMPPPSGGGAGILIAGLLLAGVGVGGYFLLRKKKKKGGK